MRSGLIAFLAAACAACGDSAGIDDEATFISEPIAFTAGMEEEAAVGSFIGSLQVDGIFIMPDPCHTLEGTLSRTSGQVTVTITAKPGGGGCPGVLQAMDYRMQTFGVGRGAYRVTVYHRNGDQPRRLIEQADVVVN
jgi:hypothetical protein